jgi:Fe2+ transport system protein FeoA
VLKPILSYGDNVMLQLEKLQCDDALCLRLREIGIVPGTKLCVIARRSNGSIVIAAQGIKLALDAMIARHMFATLA